MDLYKIFKAAREIGVKNFVEYAKKTNMDEGQLMITFTSFLTHTRIIGNWGREEDSHDFIGLDEEGWIVYGQIVESAGPFEIKSENVHKVNDDYIVNKFESLGLKDQLDFIGKCMDIRGKHTYEFDLAL